MFRLSVHTGASLSSFVGRLPSRIMKARIALLLLLAGTNVFTYATTRYWTTDHVLSRAAERVLDVQQRQREGRLPPHQPPEQAVRLAISMAGGMYHWWNDGLPFWGLGAVLTISSFLVTKLELTKEGPPYPPSRSSSP